MESRSLAVGDFEILIRIRREIERGAWPMLGVKNHETGSLHNQHRTEAALLQRRIRGQVVQPPAAHRQWEKTLSTLEVTGELNRGQVGFIPNQHVARLVG